MAITSNVTHKLCLGLFPVAVYSLKDDDALGRLTLVVPGTYTVIPSAKRVWDL
jgi:hypothetical protein